MSKSRRVQHISNLASGWFGKSKSLAALLLPLPASTGFSKSKSLAALLLPLPASTGFGNNKVHK